MNYLVDTHVLLWSFFEPERLSSAIQNTLQEANNEIFYSPINLWEISFKYGLKKLSLNEISPEEFFIALEESFFLCKPVEPLTVLTSFHLPIRHKDPFDRFLIWDAIRSHYSLLSMDEAILAYQQDGLKVVR
jgi:PIN domain nuclease of toxin-antitoxin system